MSFVQICTSRAISLLQRSCRASAAAASFADWLDRCENFRRCCMRLFHSVSLRSLRRGMSFLRILRLTDCFFDGPGSSSRGESTRAGWAGELGLTGAVCDKSIFFSRRALI